MRLYQTCSRKWHHAYVCRRVARRPSLSLSRGTQLHEWLARFWARHPDLSITTAGSDPVVVACAIGYRAYWKEPPPGGWIVEHPWEATIAGVPCAGTVDAIGTAWKASEAEGVTIVEHKTTSEAIEPGSVYWRRVTTTDVQVSFYRAAFPGARILYDVVRKPSLRQKQNETPDQFAARCLEAITEEPARYFQRATVVRLEAEDEAFAQDVVSVDRLRRAGPWPRNPSQCFAYGQRCEYFDVCWGHQSLSDDSAFADQEAGR